MDETDVAEFLKAEIEKLRADRDAALESERRLWRAYSMAKGAAEYLTGALDLAWKAWADCPADVSESIGDALDVTGGDVRTAEKLAGVAVE